MDGNSGSAVKPPKPLPSRPLKKGSDAAMALLVVVIALGFVIISLALHL